MIRTIDSGEDLRQAGVYWIVNVKTGKYYIGSARNLRTRLMRHLRNLKARVHSSDHLQRAVDKYGLEAFHAGFLQVVTESEVIASGMSWKEYLLREEQAWFDKTWCFDPEIGYNVNSKSSGVDHTPEIRAKIAKAQSGKKQSQETIAKRVAKNLGKKRTAETKKLMSEKATGRIMSADSVSKSVSTRRANGNLSTEATRTHGRNLSQMLKGLSEEDLLLIIRRYSEGIQGNFLLEGIDVTYRTLLRAFGHSNTPPPPAYRSFLEKLGFDGRLGYGLYGLRRYLAQGLIQVPNKKP